MFPKLILTYARRWTLYVIQGSTVENTQVEIFKDLLRTPNYLNKEKIVFVTTTRVQNHRICVQFLDFLLIYVNQNSI